MTCPICAKDTIPEFRPFCSKRCADRDLGAWLTGAYRVPSQPGEDDEEAMDELIQELENAQSQPAQKRH